MEPTLNAQSPTEIFPDNPDGAEGLRNQAAACRRLAGQARTSAGTSSMNALADHFDEQARRADVIGPGTTDGAAAAGLAK
jgi:hypothetical protein